MQILTKKMVVSVLQHMKRRQPNGKLYCMQCYMLATGIVRVSIYNYNKLYMHLFMVIFEVFEVDKETKI